MGDLSLGKNKKSLQVSQQQLLQGGIKKEQLKNKKLESLFDAADKNNDGVLDKSEAENLLELLNEDNDETISSKEAKKYLKDANLKDLKAEDLYEFLQELSQAAENIESSSVQTGQNGEKTITINYTDQSTETIFPDKSKEITTSENGASVTKRFENGRLTKEARTTDTEIIVTEFDADEKPVTQTITAKDGNSVKTIQYEDGKPKSAQFKNGITTENYTYDENGKEVKTSKVENEGIEAKERRTTYEYGEDNTVTENITEPGRITTRTLKDDKLQTEIVTESDKIIKTTIAQDGTTTVRTEFNDNTATEVVTDTGDNRTTTKFNADGKRLSQTVTKDGQAYEVEYDGKGNTYIIVQNAETPGSIAQKFKTNQKTLLGMNKHHTDELGNKYFDVSAKIKVPGELKADDERLTNRKDAAGAKSAYITSGGAAREAAADQEVKDRKDITWTEKKHDTFEQIARDLFKKEGVENPSDLQLSKRIKDLKKDNPDLVDGKLKGNKIRAGVSQSRYDEVVKAEKERKAKEAEKQDEITQKESAKQIVAD